MIRFGWYYLGTRLVIFDLSCEEAGGRTSYVAALSEHPHVQFRAVRPETAVERLKAHLALHGLDGAVRGAGRLAG